MNPYQYCTRCGDELSDRLKERYRDEHHGGPVLCQDCMVEVFKGIGKAMQTLVSAIGDELDKLFEPEQ